jgi:hypothetical protein
MATATATKNGTVKAAAQSLTIPAPNFQIASFRIRGDAPLVMNKFSEKMKQILHKQHEEGSTARKGKKKEPKDFQALYEQAFHRSPEGWVGIPASAFRSALVSACRTVGFHMTKAKLAAFVMADGYEDDGTPLVKITKGEPSYHEAIVRNQTGVPDVRPRPMWAPGWEAEVRIRFDADMFTLADVANLMMRVGAQVGILEGRPDSKNSTGQGWGTFELVDDEAK